MYIATRYTYNTRVFTSHTITNLLKDHNVMTTIIIYNSSVYTYVASSYSLYNIQAHYIQPKLSHQDYLIVDRPTQ